MYFTDAHELRKFEREMQQKPNFDKRRDDYAERGKFHHPDDETSNLDGRNKDGG